jgi:hypothetical protein
VKPGEAGARRLLFDEDPPKDSRIFALRELGEGRDAQRSRRGPIVTTRSRTASCVHRREADDATVLAGTRERDEPAGADQQTSPSSERKRGRVRQPLEIKGLIEEKLEQAQSAGGSARFMAGKADRGGNRSRLR